MNKALAQNKGINDSIPLISVVLPVYNGEKYLPEAIDSILGQTFTNFELIIIDDGSTDNSLAILKHYERRDKRIRLVAQENKNLATTLNDLIDLARGEWIARMDQDDIALSHRFDRQLQWLEHTGADICGSWVQFFGSKDNRVLKHSISDAAIKIELLFEAPFAHPTVMMKTSSIRALMYDKVWEQIEDYDLWERAARAGWVMCNIPEILLLYRQHGSQISANSTIKRQNLAEDIRRRYWTFLILNNGLKYNFIEELINVDNQLTDTTIEMIEEPLLKLLLCSNGEARQTLLDYALRIYIKLAVDHSNIVSKWDKMNMEIGNKVTFTSKLSLILVRLFRIRKGSIMFGYVKKMYHTVVG